MAGTIRKGAPGTKVLRFQNGEVKVIADTPAVEAGDPRRAEVVTVSSDGNLALVRYDDIVAGSLASGRLELIRNGQPSPVATFDVSIDAKVPVLSSNGEWLAVNGGRSAVVYRMIGGSIQRVAARSDAAVTRIAGNGLASTSPPSLWNPVTGAMFPLPTPLFNNTLPSPELSNDGRFAFYFQMTPSPVTDVLLRLDTESGAVLRTEFSCPRRQRPPFPPGSSDHFPVFITQATLSRPDPTGRWIRASCLDQSVVVDGVTGSILPLGSPGTPDMRGKSLIQVGARDFRWLYEGEKSAPAAAEWEGYNKLALEGVASPAGYLAHAGKPDFTLIWGNRELRWVGGERGLWYAETPRDLRAGSPDTLQIVSAVRPHLNTSIDIRVRDAKPAIINLDTGTATDGTPVHGDYRGLVTKAKPGTPGEVVHLFVRGVETDKYDFSRPLYGELLFVQGPNSPARGLPVEILYADPSGYGDAFFQISIRLPAIPESLRGYSYGGQMNINVPFRDGPLSTWILTPALVW